jgi:6-phosphofructokinase 1
MPAGFIRRDGYGITAAARRYLEPLIRGEAYPPYGADGLPAYAIPTGALAVRRKLAGTEAPR